MDCLDESKSRTVYEELAVLCKKYAQGCDCVECLARFMGEEEEEETHVVSKTLKRAREPTTEKTLDGLVVPDRKNPSQQWNTGLLFDRHSRDEMDNFIFMDQSVIDGKKRHTYYVYLDYYPYDLNRTLLPKREWHKCLDSVSAFTHYPFKEYDKWGHAIRCYEKSRKDRKNKYFEFDSPHAIAESWDKNNTDASDLGTEMHETLEFFFNGQMLDPKRFTKKEIEYFRDFAVAFDGLSRLGSAYTKDVPVVDEKGNKLKMLDSEKNRWKGAFVSRTEWMFWIPSLRVPGALDLILVLADGTYIIIDFKGSKEIKHDSFEYGDVGTGAAKDLPNCNYSQYSIQQNSYKYGLERDYKRKISLMYLLILHKNHSGFLLVRINDLQNVIHGLGQERLAYIAKHGRPPRHNPAYPPLTPEPPRDKYQARK